MACNEKLFDTAFADALKVAAWFDVTADTLAANPMLLVPAAMLIEEGTVIAALVLERLTSCPPVGAVAFRFTVHATDAGATIELLPHERALIVASPAPLRPIAAEGEVDELLA